MSLYRGMASPLVALPMYVAISFTSLDFFKKVVNMRETEGSERPEFGRLLIAAALSGIPTALVGTPQDLFKLVMQKDRLKQTQLHVEQPNFKGSFDVAQYIYRHFGIRGCFKGLTVTLFREVPG